MDKSRRLFLANTTFGALGAGLFENTLCRLSNEGAIKIHDNKPESAVKNYYKSIKFISDKKSSSIVSSSVVVEKAKSVFYRIAKERTGIDIMADNGDELKIQLAIYPNSLPGGGFRINYENNSLVTISSGDEMGIYYGIGKFLHTSVLNEDGIKPGTWSGSSVPKKSLRAIYFATHFHNYYHVAPISEVSDYIEELALWGYNHLVMWFDKHHFENINTQQSQKMLDRLAQLYKIGESVGMFPYCGMLANEGYSDSPIKLRAEKTGRSHYGVEICPSIDAGKKLILAQSLELLKAFEDRGVIFKVLSLWPYDQGGCGCKLCAPWGSNGFVNISRSISYELRKHYPDLKISLSTWLFDYGSDQGEWKGLEQRFQDKKPEWVDYLLADSHTSYPQFLLDNPVPGNLPLINFPEISMWGQWPWGGFGASPLPNRFKELWDVVKDRVVGGWPYSEGIFEDMNKVLYSQFYWYEDIDVEDVLREYISYEYSEEYVEEILQVIDILEKNHGLTAWKWYQDSKYGKIDVPEYDYGSEEARNIMEGINDKLSTRVKESWRWRLLLIRSQLDHELRLTGGIINSQIETLFEEINTINHYIGGEGSHRIGAPLNYGSESKNINKSSKPVD